MGRELKYETEKEKRREKDWKTDQIKIKNTKFGKHNQKKEKEEERLENRSNKNKKYKIWKT